MEDFFLKTFEEQGKCIIKSGDLSLLQAFIGIHNPIGLLQYYSSFITTKINLIDTRLHGEYEFQKECLTRYKADMEKKGNASSSLSYTTVSDVGKDIKSELLSKLLLPESNAQKETVGSICNTDFMSELTSDQELVSYTRNTEINSLCTTNREQVGEMFDALVQQSRVFLKRLIEKHPYSSLEQKREIDDEITVLTKKIKQQRGEITKYRQTLQQIKDRSFLADWYPQLMNSVKIDAKEKHDHALYKYFPKDVRLQEGFVANVENLFFSEVVSRLLKEIVRDKFASEQLDRIVNIIKNDLNDDTKFHYLSFVERTNAILMEEINKSNDDSLKEILQLIISEIKPEKVMKAEQSVLDDILFEAVLQEQQNCALLLICNGADINLQRELEDKTKVNVRERLDKKILEKSGLLVIKMLYEKMPLMKASMFSKIEIQTLSEFVVEGAVQSDEGCKEITISNILSLPEIRDIFPDNTVIKKAADTMVKCDSQTLLITETYEKKKAVLKEMKLKFDSAKKKYTTPSWKWAAAAVPLAAAGPVGVSYGLGCALAYVAAYLGVVGVASAVDLGIPWKARRNAQNELEVAQEDLDRATEMFQFFLEILQMSVVAGSDIFLERCIEVQEQINIMKRNQGKWVNFTNVLKAFENAQAAADSDSGFCFATKSVKFSELAEDVIRNRVRYMNDLSQSGPPNKSTNETVIIENTDNVGKETEKKKAESKRAIERGKKGESKVEILENLIRKLQTGEISVAEIQQIDVKSLGPGPSHEI